MNRPRRKVSIFFKSVSAIQSLVLIVFFVLPPNVVQAQTFNVLNLPKPGSMVGVSENFVPVLLKGISLHPENPLVFDFIVDPGNTGFGDDQIRNEGERLIKYFLAALTVPEKDLWVNLSPYEKDRIIPTAFGQTEMGRDLLAQDYILKQISASMIYPEKDLGKDFWGRIYQKAKEVYGTDKIPVSTFNKVWIVPDSAVIVETEKSAFVARGHLKVMLEEDYAAINQNRANEILGDNRFKDQDLKKMNNISSAVVREIILPEIEREVNEGKNFAQLRQIYYSLVLAAWFKNNLKDNLINQVYADQRKIAGVDIDDKNDKEKIYQRYMEAYRQGVFNYIRDDVDDVTQEMIPRKYFSGGANFDHALENSNRVAPSQVPTLIETGKLAASDFKSPDVNNPQRSVTVALNLATNRNSELVAQDRPQFQALDRAGERLQGLEGLIVNPQSRSSENFNQAADVIRAIQTNPASRQIDTDSVNRILAATPIEVLKANGFTEADHQNAFEATTNQLKSVNPQTRLQAALTLSSTGDNTDQVRNIIAEPFLNIETTQPQQQAIRSIEPVFVQMPQARQVEALQATVILALTSNNVTERETAQRIVASTPREVAVQAGLNEGQINNAVTATQGQLTNKNTALPAAYALKAAGVNTSEIDRVIAEPIGLPTQQPGLGQLKSIEITLSALPEAERGQALSIATPVLREALNGQNPSAREVAERVVVQMTPTDQKAAGFTAAEIQGAQQGTLNQMIDNTQPEIRVAAAKAIVLGDIQAPVGPQSVPAVTLARAVMAEPLKINAQGESRPSVISIEPVIRQMSEVQQINVLREVVMPALSSGNVTEQQAAERMVTAAPRAIAEQAGLSNEQITNAITSTEGQLTRRETSLPAAYALGVTNTKAKEIIAQPLGSERAVLLTQTEQLTLPVMQALEIKLSAPQISSAQRAQMIQPTVSLLMAALRDNTNPEIQEIAQRAVAQMTPLEQESAGFSAQDVKAAQAGTLRQMTDTTLPERQIAAAKAIVSANIQESVGPQNMPAVTYAEKTIESQPAEILTREQGQRLSAGQLRAIENAFSSTDMTQSSVVETLKTVAPELRTALTNLSTTPEAIAARESAERTIAALPSTVQASSGFSPTEINTAQRNVVKQLENDARPDVKAAAARAIASGDIQLPVGPKSIPAVQMARLVISEPMKVGGQAAGVKQLVSSIEPVFVQMPQARQVEALQATVILALTSNNVTERETAQRIVASTPREVAVQAGLNEGQINNAVTATQGQLTNKNTALPAAYALKAAGVNTSEIDRVIAEPIGLPTQQPGLGQLKSIEITLSALPEAERGQALSIATPVLREALNGQNPSAREVAERVVVQMTPTDQKAAGFTAAEIQGAQQGTLNQMIDNTQPEIRVAAAKAIVLGDIQAPVGPQSVPAVTLARAVMAEPLKINAQGESRPSVISIEPVIRQMSEVQQINVLREVVMPALSSGNVTEQQAAERMVTAAPRAIAEQAGLSNEQITNAITSTEGQLTRRETSLPAAYALGVTNTKAKEIIAQPIVTTKVQQAINSLESVFVQMPQARQVEALQATVIPALSSNNATERDAAQRIVAATPREVAAKAGLSEGQIAGAVTATQVQMEKPETALPAAYALKASGIKGESLASADQIINQKFAALKDLGGIDFNPAAIKMEITKENGGIKVKFDPKLIEEIRAKGVEGFIPVILNIKSLTNALPLLTENSAKEQTILLSSL